MKTGTTIVAALSLFALIGFGCGRGPHPGPSLPPGAHGAEPNNSRDILANSVFGGVNVTAMDLLCAGRVQLSQGAATIKDTCFTGDTNVVLCTDTSSASAVQCAASSGKLELAGTGSDLINYARVR
jgi:hypothetical protein